MTPAKWIHLLAGAGLILCFFLPWAAWKDSLISGYFLPAGKFFGIAETKFGLGNPFPQLNFTFYIFWLIPVLAAAAMLLSLQNKKNGWFAGIAGALALALVTVFYLFTKALTDLGVGDNVYRMMQLPAWASALFSVLLIATANGPANSLKKTGWILAGPVFAFGGFMIIQQKVWNQTFSDTRTVKADYTVSAMDLIRDFTASDSAANAKYREKILVVNGTLSEVERLADSTTNIKFADSTGSYIIFSFDKDQFVPLEKIKPGDAVSLKGSCSGSIRSGILGTTSISFKRSTLNK